MKRLMIALLFALVAGALLAPETATAFRRLAAQHGYQAGKRPDPCAVRVLSRVTEGVSAVMREVLASRQNDSN